MDYEDQDELMPQIIEATQDAITSEEEEESGEEDNIIDNVEREDLNVNEMFENKKEEKIIKKTPQSLKVLPVRKETEKEEDLENDEKNETDEKNLKGVAYEKKEKRRKQLEQLKRMRERKKQLAEERALRKEEEEEEPETPRPRKKSPPRVKTPENKKVSFESDELEDFMENIAVRSIQRYKAQKKKKKEKQPEPEPPKPEPPKPKPNPIKNIITPQWTEEDLYSGFF